MNNNYKKKYTKKDLFLLNKYLIKFKLKNISSEYIAIFKTKNYQIEIYKNGFLTINGQNFENITKMLGDNTTCCNANDKKLDNVIGSDEVGTGDTFGGIVVCACYIEKENIDFVKELKITDSKKYSNKQIEELFLLIKDKVKYSIVNFKPNQYNELYEKFKNLNIVKSYCHNNAIESLIKDNNIVDYNSIIDEFTPLNNYIKYLRSINIEPIKNIKTFTKAETKFLQVAAASIIGRYFFIQQINELSNQYKIDFPFGSTNPKIKTILESIYKKDKSLLKNIAKLHFKNVSQIIK